jgi:hypothetical protein
MRAQPGTDLADGPARRSYRCREFRRWEADDAIEVDFDKVVDE